MPPVDSEDAAMSFGRSTCATSRQAAAFGDGAARDRTAEELRGKVVLVDFWEYTCVNWMRTSPYVKDWNRVYAPFGLVVIGLHAPEFEFGKNAGNIDRRIRDHELTYPIAIDNDFAIWSAFGNDAWPAKS
jgi:hypothetical protein